MSLRSHRTGWLVQPNTLSSPPPPPLHSLHGPVQSTDTFGQVTEECSRLIFAIKASLCGEGDADSTPEMVTAVANEVYNTDLLAHLVSHMPKLEFEARKDVGHIFNTLLRRTIGTRLPTVELMVNKPEIIFTTLKG